HHSCGGSRKNAGDRLIPRQGTILPHPLEAEFEAWWSNCWRKIGKGFARKSYYRARQIVDAETLLATARRFRQILKERDTPMRFQPHPSTWLNGERWLDEDERIQITENSVHGLSKFVWRTKLDLWRRQIMPWNGPGNPPGSGGYVGPVDLMTAVELELERNLRNAVESRHRSQSSAGSSSVGLAPRAGDQ
ncbi:MAG: hypothetical protein KGJ13_09025, partial [Patescibacteria group bacterium]|nr:hypothetical protein [Patescibacteria group bacterium]